MAFGFVSWKIGTEPFDIPGQGILAVLLGG